MPLPDVFVRECVRSHVCVKVCALARVCVTTQRASNLEQHPPAISLQISTPCFLMCLFLYIDGDRLGSVLLVCVYRLGWWFIDWCPYCYAERNMRMIQIQDNISEQKNLKDKLESEQEKLHVDYNKVSGGGKHTLLEEPEEAACQLHLG